MSPLLLTDPVVPGRTPAPTAKTTIDLARLDVDELRALRVRIGSAILLREQRILEGAAAELREIARTLGVTPVEAGNRILGVLAQSTQPSLTPNA
ncbi:hypothetical protein [Cereibacter sphaeroides]|uniref:hypothetical protein n=1 Tax=Cereibacter sphaeroides TaxID=1063 RepID=UPI001F3B9767|nr:hypothetical protein [Cereibacter sphaeroides]MCE6972251.1 hypothetical protein [Cereibacter sphaeroides]